MENELVHMHADAGIPCKRVEYSGGIGAADTADLRVACWYVAEVKGRKKPGGFKTIEGWLDENDLLFIKRNRREHLVVMPWKTYVELMQAKCRESGGIAAGSGESTGRRVGETRNA